MAEREQANAEVLVVDANILIRAVRGVRVRGLIVKYASTVDVFAPDTAWAEAREHLPIVLRKRGIPVEAGVSLLTPWKTLFSR